jgi:hypothetical protein
MPQSLRENSATGPMPAAVDLFMPVVQTGIIPACNRG